MNEVGALLDEDHNVIWWHVPPGRTAGSLPDDRTLWDQIWRYRSEAFAFAHVHPGVGPVTPSSVDLSTFAAIEQGLGRCLMWPILSSDHAAAFCRFDDGVYRALHGDYTPRPWIDQLRTLAASDRLQTVVAEIQTFNLFELHVIGSLFEGGYR